MATATNFPKSSWRSKLSTYFEAHGRFCASHPWEVIVTTVTLTVSALSMSVLSGGKVGTICGISKPCIERPGDVEKADTVMLSVVNCLAVIYIYNQFSKLRKAGSKYLLGIAGLFTIFSSFVFGSTVVNLIDDKVSGLNEALPFFLLLIDLSKASSLAKFAFRSGTKEEVRENIGRGIAELGPTMTLDTLVEVLLISIGTISGVPQFETLCCFGSMSIIANYLVFMTFFPASLALVLEVCPIDPENKTWHIDELARSLQQEERKPNPVAQRVKIIMALGLAVVHIHSRFFSALTGLYFGFASSHEDEGSLVEKVVDGDVGDFIEKVPLPDYLWWKMFNLSVDQMITVLLASVLFVKYIFLDKSGSFSPASVPSTPAQSRKNSKVFFSSSKPIQTSTSCPFLPPQSKAGPRAPSTLTMNYNPGPLNGAVQTDSFERLRNGGIVISAQPSGALPAPPESTAGGTLEGSQLSLLGSRSKSSGDFKTLTAELTEPVQIPKSDLVLSASATASVGTQTDSDDSELRALFTVGDSGVSELSTSEYSSGCSSPQRYVEIPAEPRPLNECLTIYKSDDGAALLTDEEIQLLVKAKHIPAYKLETALGNNQRGVCVRRKILEKQMQHTEPTLTSLPFKHYDYSLVSGACCENVIGYMPIPVGYAGPLLLDGKPYHVPMSTTEGALVASTNRGCRALSSSGGVCSSVLDDGMTRGPVVRCPSAAEAGAIKNWLEDPDNFESVAEVFNSTSRFARLKGVQVAVAGRLVYVRFKAFTGDAMGMNMLSKGVEKSLSFMKEKFPQLEVISLSGNYCTDKKPAAINWIEGRGKSVVCEATIPAQVVKQVLKTNVDALVDLNISKNLVGSAMAGSLGGFNAHAANVVTAIFIATGQDPAQNIASSNCITLMERSGSKGEDLYISCTMPSIEIGTVGGGTILGPQSACLSMVGVKGPNRDNPGENAKQLARIVCGTVLAGELSLLSALAAGHLVKSHLTHNRSQINLPSIPESLEGKEHRRTRSDSTSMFPTSSSVRPPSPSALKRRRASVQGTRL